MKLAASCIALTLPMVLTGCDRGADSPAAPSPTPPPPSAEAPAPSDDMPRDQTEAPAADEQDQAAEPPPGHALRLPTRRSVPAESITDESWLGLLVSSIEEAHGRAAWSAESMPMLRARLNLEREGEPPIELALRINIAQQYARLELPDGSVVLRRGDEVWRAPGPQDDPPPEARAWIETLPRLLCMPLILRQPGHRLSAGFLETVGDEQYASMTLTFSPDPEFAAHHWYAVFADPFRNHIKLIACYFSNDPTLDPDWQPQHAVTFHEYEAVDGVTLPTMWRLHRWSRSRGLLGEPLGAVRVTTIAFEPPTEGVFEPRANAEHWPAPDAEDATDAPDAEDQAGAPGDGPAGGG